MGEPGDNFGTWLIVILFRLPLTSGTLECPYFFCSPLVIRFWQFLGWDGERINDPAAAPLLSGHIIVADWIPTSECPRCKCGRGMFIKATHKKTETIYIWYLSRHQRMVLIARQIEMKPFFYSSPGQWPTTAAVNDDNGVFGSQVN